MLLLAGAMTVGRPLSSQQKAMPVVGILPPPSLPSNVGELGRDPYHQGLR